MPKRLRTFDAVIDALGGPSAVARMCRRTPAAVTAWRTGGERFPPKFYFLMAHALEARGLEAPRALWGFEEINYDADAA